jgi:putative hydrolase of the HAD superfamily
VSSYRHLLFDLDNTLWNFSSNAKSALLDVYEQYQLNRYYPDFEDYFHRFEVNNTALWRLYGADKITKEFLNMERFLSPLRPFGILNTALATEMSKNYLDRCSEKTAIMPNTIDTLNYLQPRYTLHIISNGFRELQYKKIERSGLSGYFSHVFLSEEIGFHKPKQEFFNFTLHTIGAKNTECLVIGDNYEVDIEGAMNVGIDQVYYTPATLETPAKSPTYTIRDLSELHLFL